MRWKAHVADEFSRIDEILRRLRQDTPAVDVANGDDAAVLRIEGSTVLSVDAAVEGTHFQRAWLRFDEIGYRSLVCALSDLAAMGASPRAILTSLIVPCDVIDEDVYALADGCAQAAAQYGAPVIGGNLSRGTQLSLTTTVVGSITQPALRRSGARPGDVLYVTGSLGEAAIGLRLLQAGTHSLDAQPFVTRWKRPTARTLEGTRLLGVANAAIDISDGLLQDLGHVCRASQVGACIDVAEIPLATNSETCARSVGASAVDLALSGGEDYELLFTASAGRSLPIAATAIGTIRSQQGIVLRENGVERDAPTRAGFRHFE